MAGAYPIGSIAGLIRISGAASAQRDILGVQRSMSLTGETAGRAAAGIGKTEAALGGVGTASTRAASGSAKFRASQLSAIAASERYNTVLADEDASLARLASAEAAVIRANERMKASAVGAAAPVARLGAEAEASGGMMSRAATSVGGFVRTAAGLGVALGGFELVKKALDVTHQASDFNAAMVRVETQAGATDAEVKNFSGDVLGLAGKVAQAPDALALSLYHVYSATKALGYTAPQMLDAVKTAAEGATVSGADLEETTNALTATMVSGLGSVNDMSSAMGALNAIVGAGDMKLSDLNEALGTGILAAVKVYGVSLSQAGAALAVFGDNNIRGADGATKLRMSIQDLSKPAAHADEVLGSIGLTTTSLRDDLEKGGLTLALHHLKQSLEDAGVTGDRVGGFLQDAFTKKAGVGLAILLNNLDQYDQKQKQIATGAGGFGAAWKATTETASFAFKKLGAEAEAQGIILTQKLLPAGARVATFIAGALVSALHTGHDVLVPLSGAWHVFASTLEIAGHAVADVAHFIEPISPVLKFLATDVLATWAAFKGYQIARFAMNSISDGIATLRARSIAGLASARAYGAGVSATFTSASIEAELAARIEQAAFTETAAAALESAAAVDRAAATKAVAYAASRTASETSSVAEIAAADASATAATAQAAASTEAAAASAAAASAAATAVTEAGATASLGWKAMLGPIAIVGTGIALLSGLFGGNSDAAAEDAANVDSLTAALERDNLAVGDTTRSWIAHKIATSGVLALQDKLGISYQVITEAALGNKNALGQVKAAWDALDFSKRAILNKQAGTNIGDLITTLGNLGISLGVAKDKAWQENNAQVALGQAHRDGAQAASRNADALGNLAAGAHGAAVAVDTTTSALHNQHTIAAALFGLTGREGVSAYLAATKAARDNTEQTKAQTLAFQAENDAASLLGQALDGLAGIHLAVASAQTASAASLRALTTSFHDNGSAIDDSTKKGIANQQAVQQQVQTDQALATAIGKKTQSGKAEIQSLRDSRDAALAAADAQGVLTPKVRDYITSLYNVKGVSDYLNAHPTKLDADTRAATARLNRLKTLMDQINAAHPTVHVGITGGSTTPGHYIPPTYSGGGLPEGVSSVGERGAELAIKNGRNVQILSNPQSHKFLAATGMRAPGFAAGTDPSPTGERATLNPRAFLGASSASAERSAFGGLLDIAKRAGLSGPIVSELKHENKELTQAIKDRNHLDDLVDKANARLVADEKKRAAELRAVKTAITGSFDVTTAGAGFDGSQPVSGGSMIAQEKQAALRAKTFVTDIKKLSGKVGDAYLYQLAEKGPDALPEVQALLSLSPKQLRGFRADEQSLSQSGQSLGQFIGKRRFGGQITDDRAELQLIRHADASAERNVKLLGDRIVKQLEHAVGKLSNPKINVYLPDGKQLARVVQTGMNKNARRN